MRIQVIPTRVCSECKKSGRGVRSSWWVDDDFDLAPKKIPIKAEEGGGFRKMTKEEYQAFVEMQLQKVGGCVTCGGGQVTNDDWGFGGIAKGWINQIKELG